MFILEAVGGIGGPKEPYKNPGETNKLGTKPQDGINKPMSFADEINAAFDEKKASMRKEEGGNTEIAKG